MVRHAMPVIRWADGRSESALESWTRGRFIVRTSCSDELWAEKQRQDDIEDAGYEVIRWIWRTAHAPDEEFARRLLRKLDRGLRLKQLRDTG
jgi:hypothetical protein